MKRNIRGMTLAAMLLSASASVHAGDQEYADAEQASQAFVGDLGVQQVAHNSTHVGNLSSYSPVTVGDMQLGSTVSQAGCTSCDSFSCDGGCDSSCDSRFGSGKRFGRLLNLCDKDGWIRAEGMIMFMEARTAPALVTTADPTQFPVLPDPNNGAGSGATTQVVFGEELDGGVSGGTRFDVGRYLSDNFGIGGRFMWLSENGDDFSASGNGTGDSIGRPFFQIPLAAPGTASESALIVNQFSTNPGINSQRGTVNASFSTDLLSAEAYARMMYCKNKSSRVELIGGYSFFRVDDNVSISSRTTDVVTNTFLADYSDFDTQNEFHGGQIGYESLVSRGAWTVRMLTKVHMGNMSRTVTNYARTDVGVDTTITNTYNSSLLVDENQGTEEESDFTFIPELNLTLGYRFRDHVSFTVGYNFLYFDKVALAGEQINRNVDGTDGPRNIDPADFDFDIVDGSLWVQGISLGTTIDY
ncbi:BBP7 family outer membrane beta-barrel protein [Roseiconus lacunae]|uniref:BBP7 family outer membrane beta-barrel protein n=1 Tax=Roseiconus lacunae TaxID=2605694 RepID=UPI0011F36CB7|nr:BBP7 family outer membrane beta-barrel protein [Roseiconus lacunae]MCD0461573.1 BBP7 family outer membrane beta-barrel protein [Roseiconus lacunae]